MKKLALLLALVLAFAPLGMAYFSPDDSDSVSNSITTSSSVTAAAVRVVPTTSAARLASGATAGTIIMINDSNTAEYCGYNTTNAGTTFVVCVSDGTNWVPIA